MSDPKGWISLHRKIKDHWVWNTGEPFTRRDAWIDLLLRATHSGKKFLLGNDLIRLAEGEFITSERKLSEEWKWSRTKVRGFLSLLEEDGMITNEKTTHYTKLSICNYSSYQRNGRRKKTTEKPDKNQEETTEEPQKNTINNDNNVNNDNKSTHTSRMRTGEREYQPGEGPELDEVIEYGNMRGISKNQCEIYYYKRSRNHWLTHNKYTDQKEPIQDWRKDLIYHYKRGWLKPDQNSKRASNHGYANGTTKTRGDLQAEQLKTFDS